MGGVIARWGLSLTVVVGAALASSAGSRAQEQQLRTASAALSAKIKAAAKRNVAVVDFTDLQTNVTELGRFLAEELQGALSGDADAHGFVVVDRTHLKAILQEHKLAASGLIDPVTARKLGEIAGVDCLVTGSLTPLGDSVRLSIKALDTTSARVVGTASVDVPRTEAIASLLAREITSSSSSGGGKPARSSTTAVGGGGSVTVDTIRFELQSCRHAADQVRCGITLTNTGAEDVNISVWIERMRPTTTRAYDTEGVLHSLTAAMLGGVQGKGLDVSGRLISGVPTTLALTFGDTTATSWSALYVRFNIGNAWKDAVLRNVRIES